MSMKSQGEMRFFFSLSKRNVNSRYWMKDTTQKIAWPNSTKNLSFLKNMLQNN